MSYLFMQCASAEDIRFEVNRDEPLRILYDTDQILKIVDNNQEYIGYIDFISEVIPICIVIDEIFIFNDRELSLDLTDKYKNKILITSKHVDDITKLTDNDLNVIAKDFVISEDLKIDTNSDKIFYYQQGGISPTFIKDGAELGFVNQYVHILGADIVIDKIKMYNNDELTNSINRSQKYLGKILILSMLKDNW